MDEIKPLFISRKGINPFIDFLTFADLITKLIGLKPSVVLLFTIKPVIYGALAARILRVPCVVTITGLGTAFITDSWITKIVKKLYGISLSGVFKVLFQNSDDQELFISQGLVDAKACQLIPGSGVDLDKFSLANFKKEPPLKFLFVGRMLTDKGVHEFVGAAREIHKERTDVQFQLLGPLDVENRTAIKSTQMEAWIREGVVQYLGETDHVESFIEKANCVVLPLLPRGLVAGFVGSSGGGKANYCDRRCRL